MAKADACELPCWTALEATGLRHQFGEKQPANDNQESACAPRDDGRSLRPSKHPQAARLLSVIPEDAVAVIEPWPSSLAGPRKKGSRGWRLRFLPRGRAGVDPLTGWAGSADTLSQIELRFASREEALRYAERHGLAVEVHYADAPSAGRSVQQQGHSPLWLCCWPTGPHPMCCGRSPVLQTDPRDSLH